MEYPEWYNNFIESPIRDLVYHLRNAGINTTCSCGHENYIEAITSQPEDLDVIRKILFNLGYDKNGFEISRTMIFNDMQNTDRILILFNTNGGVLK